MVVLIETLWNVKARSYRAGRERKRSINRNIVECKDLEERYFQGGIKY